MKDVKLLCESSGTEIAALQPGGGHLSPMSTSLHLKTHISNDFMTLYPTASHLRIPPVELFQIITLRFYTADLFFLEHFGYLMWKDPVIVPIGMAKHSATLEDMMVMNSKKDLWASNTSLTALMNAVNGLFKANDLLIHP